MRKTLLQLQRCNGSASFHQAVEVNVGWRGSDGGQNGDTNCRILRPELQGSAVHKPGFWANLESSYTTADTEINLHAELQ